MNILKHITEKTKNWKVLVTIMAAIVVFATTYVLILPAVTLDEDTAAAQGGITMSDDKDVAASSDAAEPADAEPGDADAADADADMVKPDDAEADAQQDGAVSDDGAAAASKGELTATDEEKTYNIEVAYGKKAGIPDNAELVTEEITEEAEGYDEYLARAQEAVGKDKTVAFARFFDITIMSGDEEIQPADNVEVMIEVPENLKKKEVSAIHFGEPENEKDEAEDVVLEMEVGKSDTKKMESAVTFETDGFSVYAVVTTTQLDTEVSVDGLDGNSFYVSIDNSNGRFYFKDSLYGNYIAMTNVADIGSAALYNFEADGTGKYYIYVLDDQNQRNYVRMTDDSLAFTFSSNERTAFTVQNYSGGFFIYYLRDSGQKCAWTYDKNGFIGKVVKNAGATNKIILTKPYDDDPYNLDSKIYGILNNNDTVTGTGMLTTAVNNNTRLKGLSMTIRTEPVGRTETVYVAKDSSIEMWTFESIGGNQYYIKSSSGKYLKITEAGISLVSEPDDNCKISINSGTGSYQNKYMFTCGDSMLYLNNGNFARTPISNNKFAWMNLAELSNLTEEDFVTYMAEKVSVSGEVGDDGTIDYDVKDGDQIVIYTRVWNDQTKQYDYYIMDYDGFLIKAYASGDRITWVGSRINTMLWNFTEYTNSQGKPTYYYELQNNYTGKYIAPQISNTENPLLSDNKIGLNLNGRRNGQYYTTVIAWDDPYYDYASMYVQKQDHWQIIPAPLAKADTFYFAVMKKEESQGGYTEVETIDNNEFKITVKMQDYGRATTTGSNYRSEEMSEVLSDTKFDANNTTPDLLKKNITGDYPISTKTGRSLGDLFNNALTTNHQFLTSTYKETGYFEYDSTQNFAHLIWEDSDGWIGKERPDGGTYQKGDFVVYEELGTTNESNKYTLQHGQFLPYNDIGQWKQDPDGNDYFALNPYSSNTNEMDMHSSTTTAVPLSPLDPRKGEKMYNIPYKRNGEIPQYADHFFGVEMSAKFMQTTSGLDAWGHDLIFEFSGDDDFWLYIDDKLVLDLGGIHSALDGKINFRTGEVVIKNQKRNLRELYKEAYLDEHPEWADDEETGQENPNVTAWLDGIFKESPTLKDSEGNPIKTVFKDYSGHTMRMFYMERGAGASNLHMRFNLAAYKDGEVLLEKQVSGVESINPNTEFPFQIFYWNEDLNRYQTANRSNSVKDNTTGDDIRYQSEYSVGGKTYDDVFFLKAGQTAAIALPSEDTKYYIKECGMDPTIYDQVKINGEVEEGYKEEGSDPVRWNYETEKKTVEQCKKVIYDNHVQTNAQHALRITKKVWETANKEPGEEITAKDDSTLFCFRIFIGKDAQDNYIAYNTGKYHVKNPDGEYCIYSYAQQCFVSTHETNFDELSDEILPGEWKSEKQKATFATSPGGAADKIPIGYTVEVPGLMNGTPFQVIERSDEIPSGYNLIDYEREGTYPSGEEPNYGTINGKDEGVIVNNQHGYGINVKKTWSDKDFMDNHDPIYFAVFVKDKDAAGHETLTMKEHSIRQLGRTETSIRWFYRDLDDEKTLNDYVVYELQITNGGGQIIDPDDENVHVDSVTGEVTVPSDYQIKKVENGGTLIAGGKPNDHGYSADFHYTASYNWQTLSQAELAAGVNSKTDAVTNSRPGIKLVKTNLDGVPLAGAKFTLEKTDDPSSKKTFTSDEDGLIAVAYLPAGTEYTLTEVAAPYQHKALIDKVKIKVRNESDGVKVYVDGSDQSGEYYTIAQVPEPTVDNMPTITIKNKPFGLKAVKKDAITKEAVEGISFMLYAEKEDYNGNPMPDYTPLDGFDNLVTGSDGIIPKINLTDLKPGTYYLHEDGTPATYEKIDYYIRLTIDPTGPVTIQKATFSASAGKYVFENIPETEAKVETDSVTDNVTVTIYNKPTKAVRIIKKSYDTSDEYPGGIPLAGAEFSLYKEEQIDTQTGEPKAGERPILTGVTSDEQGKLGYLDLGTLPTDKKYYLFETKAPDGYYELTDPIIITIRETGLVSASYGISRLDVEKVTENNIEIYQITVLNSAGVELPSTGGSGTTIYYILGAILMVLAAGGLVFSRRRGIRL